MILVTGATGQLGTVVIQNLLQKTPATQVAAFMRDEGKASALKEKGVDLRLGNYDDMASLDSAMQGIDKVLLIAGTDEHKRVQQHRNVVDAAKRAGVPCIAYTGRNLKDRYTLTNNLMQAHFQTEDYIKESGLAYTLFRSAYYMDAIPFYVGEKVFDAGIYLPVGQGKAAYALRSDMGKGIANALLQDDCNNRTYKLTGNQAYSFTDIAAALTELSGKNVTYTPAEKLAYEAQMKERGLPEARTQLLTAFLVDIENGQEEEVSADLENLLGRKPVALKEGLKTLFKL